MESFANRYCLPGNRVRNWMMRLKQGKQLRQEGGRPVAIDAEGIKSVKAKVKKYREENHECPPRPEILKLMKAEAMETSKRTNTPPVVLCDRTITHYTVERSPQTTIPTRDKACSDYRMIYSTLVMATALASGILPSLLWNFDATTFIIGTPGVEEPVYIVGNDDSLVPPNYVAEDPFPFAIKRLHFANAKGDTSPLVLIIGMEEIPVGKCKIEAVPGLSYQGQTVNTGNICFCHNRAGTDSLFRWFFNDIVIKEISAF